jgi:hypothetical protein
MFVASLNLDLFFKKVFSNKRIAKHFLQDLLGVKTTEFEYLKIDNKVTNESAIVKEAKIETIANSLDMSIDETKKYIEQILSK